MKIIGVLKNLLRSVNLAFFIYSVIGCLPYVSYYMRINDYVLTDNLSLVHEQVANKNIENISLDGNEYCFTLRRAILLNESKELYDKFRILIRDENISKAINSLSLDRNIKFSCIPSNYVSAYEVLMILTLWGFIIANLNNKIESIEDDERRRKGKERVTFDDLIGLNDVKIEVKRVMSLYSDSSIRALKMKRPKGILFFGSPGNGKTMMAKAIANEFGGGFFYISASELMEIYVGVGPKKIREIFASAREEEFAVIFIDELDAIAGGRREGFGNSELHNTLNQLLVEMDGVETSSRVLVIGATNMRGVFDDALKRRFELQIDFDNPSQEESVELLKVLLKDIPSQGVNIEYIASGLGEVSRANIVSIVENAKRIACANNRFYLISDDLDEASLRHDMGKMTSIIKLKPEERWKTAYHEAGHAFMFYYYYKSGVFLDPPRYLTIVPRAHTLGFVATPNTDYYQSKTVVSISGYMQVCYAGLLAEQMFCIDSGASIGCSSDLQQARMYAENYVNFGLDEDIGYVGIPCDLSLTSNRERDSKFDRVQIICEQNLIKAREILVKNKNTLEIIARAAIHFGYLTQDFLIGLIEGKIVDSSYALVPIKKCNFQLCFNE